MLQYLSFRRPFFKEKRQLHDAGRFTSVVGVWLHAILRRHLYDAKGRQKHIESWSKCFS